MLINEHAMLECTSTLSYGDCGVSVENDDDAKSALDIMNALYREPEVIIYFQLFDFMKHIYV